MPTFMRATASVEMTSLGAAVICRGLRLQNIPGIGNGIPVQMAWGREYRDDIHEMASTNTRVTES